MKLDEFLRKVMRGRALYHFTDERNLPLIRASGGLLSRWRLDELEVDIPAPGGNEISIREDRRYGLDAYVHLCWRDNHPMAHVQQEAGHIGKIRYLEIDPAILKVEGVLYSLGVSNAADVPLVGYAQAIAEMDAQVLFTRTDWKDPEIQARLRKAEKYEVLIPNEIPAALIRNL